MEVLKVKAYLRGENTCPACGVCDDVEGQEVEIIGIEFYQDVQCLVCDATWTDVYSLDRIENLEVPE